MCSIISVRHRRRSDDFISIGTEKTVKPGLLSTGTEQFPALYLEIECLANLCFEISARL
jgi:hypothetical protein